MHPTARVFRSHDFSAKRGISKVSVPPKTGDPFFTDFFSFGSPELAGEIIYVSGLVKGGPNSLAWILNRTFESSADIDPHTIPQNKFFGAAPGDPREEFSLWDGPKAVKFGIPGICKIIFAASLENDSHPQEGDHNPAEMDLARGPNPPAK